ncbi:metallophosphoesterase [Mesorhizobium sp.]|uniref:metallophosphoesterase n=1 Tax=Mesorhizobium sp. TaxID=1871066 RepID=UPI0025EB4DF5|nr:metallophosphoesterase [Mesorhizobium sp.]
MIRAINVLHLTDLHLSSDDFAQDVVIKAFLTDLRSRKNAASRPDLIVFSGDIARSADDKAVYGKALGMLLDIADLFGLNEEKIIICPGNHDVSRSELGPNIHLVQQWQASAKDRDKANALYKDTHFGMHVFRAFNSFAQISDIFSSQSLVKSGLGYSTYFFRDLNVSCVSLNTAMLSTAGMIEGVKDEGRLCLPERLLVEAFSGIPKDCQVIVAAHHPLSWLNEDNTDLAKRIISAEASMYLSGHLHKARPERLSSMTGSCFFGQSGALYEWRDRWAGYAIYNFVPGYSHVKMQYRRWYEERRSFGKAEDIYDDGVGYSDAAAKEFLKKAGGHIDYDLLETWRLNELLPLVRSECNKTLAPVPIATSFVPPEFERERVRTKDSLEYSSKKESFTFDQISGSVSNFIISAPTQSGKTTAFRQWAILLANRTVDSEGWSIPVILSFDELRDYSTFVESTIARKLPGLPEPIKLKGLLSSGCITLFVDDVDLSHKKKLSALSEFMETYPSCRYILGSASELIESASVEPVISEEIPFTHVQLKRLKRRQLLSLIEGHNVVDNPTAADQLLERVTREARSLNVPLTAVTGSFLIQIFSAEPDRILVNQATLIERYIELLLQKFSLPEVELRSFDFTLKRDLLSVISEEMARSNEYLPYYNDTLKLVIDYVKHYGFPHDSDMILRHFIQCRILEKVSRPDGDRIRFTLRSFSFYFSAWRMIKVTSFRAWVFAPDRYLSFQDEISFYAALVRDDEALLGLIFTEFASLSSLMWVDGSEEVRNGTFMDDFVEPNADATEAELFAISDAIRSNEATDRERSEHLDGDVYSLASSNQDVSRPEFATTGDRWVALLTLASMVLKHMELIADAEKRKLLSSVITGWLQFCTFSLGMIPQIARDKAVNINGVRYKINLRKDEPMGELARRISLVMPLVVSQMATGFVGSEKLKLQLEDGIGSESEKPSAQLLRTLLLADIGVGGISKIFRQAAVGIRKHRFLEQVLARKLFDVAIRFRLSDVDLEDIRNLASDMALKIDGEPMKSVKRDAILENLRKQRLLMGKERDWPL